MWNNRFELTRCSEIVIASFSNSAYIHILWPTNIERAIEPGYSYLRTRGVHGNGKDGGNRASRYSLESEVSSWRDNSCKSGRPARAGDVAMIRFNTAGQAAIRKNNKITAMQMENKAPRTGITLPQIPWVIETAHSLASLPQFLLAGCTLGARWRLKKRGRYVHAKNSVMRGRIVPKQLEYLQLFGVEISITGMRKSPSFSHGKHWFS